MSDEVTAPATEAAPEAAPESEAIEAQDTSTGEVSVPLNERATRKEAAVEKLPRCVLRGESQSRLTPSSTRTRRSRTR